MKIYLLSLLDDHDRRAALKIHFPEHFHRFEIIPAIDGRKEKPAHNIPICRRNRNRPMSNAEIACALGHMEIYQRIIDSPASDHSFSLVLEDDVIGDTEKLDRIEKLSFTLPKKSILILGGQQSISRAKHLHGYATAWENVYRIPSFQLRNLFRTCCYILDRDMATHLFEKQKLSLNRADDWHSLLMRQHSVFFTPLLSHPFLEKNNSHIESSRLHLSQSSIFQRWHRDGWIESISRPVTRILTPIIAPMVKLHKIL